MGSSSENAPRCVRSSTSTKADSALAAESCTCRLWERWGEGRQSYIQVLRVVEADVKHGADLADVALQIRAKEGRNDAKDDKRALLEGWVARLRTLPQRAEQLGPKVMPLHALRHGCKR